MRPESELPDMPRAAWRASVTEARIDEVKAQRDCAVVFGVIFGVLLAIRSDDYTEEKDNAAAWRDLAVDAAIELDAIDPGNKTARAVLAADEREGR